MATGDKIDNNCYVIDCFSWMLGLCGREIRGTVKLAKVDVKITKRMFFGEVSVRGYTESLVSGFIFMWRQEIRYM